jgi:hypothetical protein
MSATNFNTKNEHILPERPADGWESFTGEEIEAMVFRLGNMTLMKTSENKDLGNAAFSSKKTAYRDSAFAITRKVAEEDSEWTAERIEARQRWMASQAAAIWRIDQLS